MNEYFDSLKLVAASASSRGKTLKQIISQYENVPESACYGSIEQVDILLKETLGPANIVLLFRCRLDIDHRLKEHCEALSKGIAHNYILSEDRTTYYSGTMNKYDDQAVVYGAKPYDTAMILSMRRRPRGAFLEHILHLPIHESLFNRLVDNLVPELLEYIEFMKVHIQDITGVTVQNLNIGNKILDDPAKISTSDPKVMMQTIMKSVMEILKVGTSISVFFYKSDGRVIYPLFTTFSLHKIASSGENTDANTIDFMRKMTKRGREDIQGDAQLNECKIALNTGLVTIVMVNNITGKSGPLGSMRYEDCVMYNVEGTEPEVGIPFICAKLNHCNGQQEYAFHLFMSRTEELDEDFNLLDTGHMLKAIWKWIEFDSLSHDRIRLLPTSAVENYLSDEPFYIVQFGDKIFNIRTGEGFLHFVKSVLFGCCWKNGVYTTMITAASKIREFKENWSCNLTFYISEYGK